MKKAVLVLLITASLIACKKEETTTQDCKVSKFTTTEDDSKHILEYDDSGRILVLNYERSGLDAAEMILEFSYMENKIICLESDAEGDLSSHIVYELRNGRVVKKTIRETTYNYTYDNDGFLTSIASTTPWDSHTETLKYSNGNLTELTTTYIPGRVYSLQYDLNQDRVPFSESEFAVFDEFGIFNFEDAILYEQGYFGKKSNNQFSKSNDSNQEGDFNHSYSVIRDDKGKATSMMTDGKGKIVFLEYNCK